VYVALPGGQMAASRAVLKSPWRPLHDLAMYVGNEPPV